MFVLLSYRLVKQELLLNSTFSLGRILMFLLLLSHFWNSDGKSCEEVTCSQSSVVLPSTLLNDHDISLDAIDNLDMFFLGSSRVC